MLGIWEWQADVNAENYLFSSGIFFVDIKIWVEIAQIQFEHVANMKQRMYYR